MAEELAKLRGRDLFVVGPHLVDPHVAPKKIAAMLALDLQCSAEHILTSKEAKLVHGKCSRGDLVLVESPGNQPQAAEVWMFCRVQSFSSAWALVQRLELVDVDASTDSATWTSLLPGNS